MSTALNILLVEDSDTDADLLIRFLKKEKIEFTHSRVWNKDSFISALNENNHDLIIADHTLPRFSGMEAFHISKAQKFQIPFIMVTGSVSEKILSEYAKEGVDDYFLKENLLRLPSAIEHILSKKKIEILHKNLEAAHKDIKDSINYAQIIQHAMLPDEAILKDNFPESFIYFKPKDTLSGDFYWFKKEDDLFLVAAADCTGHGIPGALMSMIGIEKLNNAVHQTKNPSILLKHLNQSIEKALCHSTLIEHSHDGMDIALCAIDKTNCSLTFAGANRPLWIIRKGQTIIEEVLGTKKAIGGVKHDDNQDFERHEIKLNEGDSIYMFSDGFADQFGGEKQKKLTLKKFMDLLISVQNLSMINQHIQLNAFIEEWKDGIEQVDDMLIIGVRIEKVEKND